MKDSQRNCILNGYYSALFSRQRRIHFPEKMIQDLYAEKKTEVKSLEELKKETAILENIKKGGLLDGRRNHKES